MRVALVNEGTYPYVTGGVSTWCDQLVRGLSDVEWDLVAIVGAEPDRPVVPVPGNVRSLVPVPVWGPGRGYFRSKARSGLARRGLGRHPLVHTPLGDVLLDAWGRASAEGVRLPRLTLREADQAAALLEHALRPLAVRIASDVDVVHA